MRIGITGGAGFIGSHIADRLLAEGHSVEIYDNLRSGARSNVPEGASLLELDLREDAVKAALARFRPQAIVHCAAQIDVRVSCQDPVFDAEENILATLRLLEAGLASGLEHFVFASSGGAIYGEASGPQGEDHPEVPLNPYGCAKLAIDKYLRAYAHQRGLRAASLRFSNVYGPRQGAKGEAGVVAVFCKRLRQGLPPIVNGDGLQTRDFVFAPDLADAVSRVLQRGAEGVFNLGTGVETSVEALAEALCGHAGLDPAHLLRGPAVPGEQRRSVLDPAKAARDLGWKAATDLTRGLEATYCWFAAHREVA